MKDKLENTKQQIENKTTDIELNSKHLVELKSQLTDLIDSCEKLYHEYDMQRIQASLRSHLNCVDNNPQLTSL